MTHTSRMARSIAVAMLTLILAVGFAAAADPEAATGGLERAAEASGKTVPVRAGHDENAEEPAEEESTEDPGAPETTTTNGEHPENHGKYVSMAAQAELPEDCDNRGAYVRIVAVSDLGKKGAEPGELPTSCEDPAPEATSGDTTATSGAKVKPAKPAHAKGKALGHDR